MAVIAKKLSLFVDLFYQVGLVEKTCQLLTDKLFREKLGTAAREHIVSSKMHVFALVSVMG
jgi:hypothetical protein